MDATANTYLLYNLMSNPNLLATFDQVQSINMVHGLYEAEPVFRKQLDRSVESFHPSGNLTCEM